LPSDEACSQSSSSEMQNQQQIMRQLPEESKREIQKQIDVFKVENFFLWFRIYFKIFR